MKKHNIMDRFIPAGAGNTSLTSFLWMETPVYPRWRGEHDYWDEGVTAKRGLSPLARGTP
ncbi:conserved hypothetical protein [Klebsiella grimontii]|uniref:Uncharacterized protein n=1 Tax=Klebsiella grimontii TaxID=2058152 RepID=A0A285B6Z8_9ENTR|nr:conserved hypothetical protein [Klebsiella grimontii]